MKGLVFISTFAENRVLAALFEEEKQNIQWVTSREFNKYSNAEKMDLRIPKPLFLSFTSTLDISICTSEVQVWNAWRLSLHP